MKAHIGQRISVFVVSVGMSIMFVLAFGIWYAIETDPAEKEELALYFVLACGFASVIGYRLLEYTHHALSIEVSSGIISYRKVILPFKKKLQYKELVQVKRIEIGRGRKRIIGYRLHFKNGNCVVFDETYALGMELVRVLESELEIKI